MTNDRDRQDRSLHHRENANETSGLSIYRLPAHKMHFSMAHDRIKAEKDEDHKQKMMFALTSTTIMDSILRMAAEAADDGSRSWLDKAIDWGMEALGLNGGLDESPMMDRLASTDLYGDANFDAAVEFVLEREGYLSDHIHDRGGLTKYGISQAAHPDIDVANLTRDEAIAIYKEQYWDRIVTPGMDMGTALTAFDTAVLQGVGTAQQMLRDSHGDLDRMLNWRLNRFESIVENDPTQATFLAGWQNRIGHLRDSLNDVYASTNTADGPEQHLRLS